MGRCLHLSELARKACPTSGKELSDDAYKIVGSVTDDIWWGASNLSVMSSMYRSFLSNGDTACSRLL